jgi:hypothetical protein
MIKKIYLFPIVILSLILIAGCGGGGGPNNPNYSEIEEMINNFESAVEAYIVTGMLNCLSDTGFQLTITEAGLSYNKDKTKLTTELNDDKDKQLAWRKSNTEDPINGHGYVLDLVLGTPSFSNETSTGAVVTQTFAVYESATSPSIARMKTDNGNITWQVAEINGGWQATAMTIEYRTLSGAALSVTGTEKRSGLGFTTFGTRF